MDKNILQNICIVNVSRHSFHL